MKELAARTDVVTDWIRQLAQRAAVYFPRRTGERSYRFEPVTADSAIDLAAYVPTIVPPNKKLMPAVDELMRFREQADHVSVDPVLDASHRILAGVRSCDLKAIALLDRAQADGMGDPHYRARRDNTAIIAVDCPKPCDDRAFCQAVRSLGHKQGADVYLTFADGQSRRSAVEAQFVVESLTPKGDDLVASAKLDACPDAAALLKKAAEARPKPFGRQLALAVDKLPATLRAEQRSAAWEKHVKSCFSCGTCTMVCPTCYCFDVKDDLGFDLVSGNRVRTWDSCMLPEFTVVAGGHNFRPEPAARQRHRVKRKFEYLMERFGGESFCVGCGRCGRQCTTHIDIFDIVNDVARG